MQNSEFTQAFEDQVEQCRAVLIKKGVEYNSDNDDPLSAFKKAAALEGCTPMQALAGMMAKHTVSVYDMIVASYPEIEAYPLEVWQEKITDHLNYLILLKAIVLEELDARIKKGSKNA